MRNTMIRCLWFALLLLGVATSSSARARIVVVFAPPPLPIYVQPVCPGDGYIWAPGYWGWDDADGDYYWVPGTWVSAPEVGFLWTPGYWAWDGNGFVFTDGYWGPTVGFYGGIDYGFGYFGVGFVGGRWNGGQFFYNRAVSNVTFTSNVYNESVTKVTVNYVSYNGGNGGITARPTPQEEAVSHEQHIAPVAAQVEQAQAAEQERDLRASVNHGKPTVAATPRPGAFDDRAVVHAKKAGAPYNPPPKSGNAEARPEASAPNSTAIHPRELPPINHPAAPNTGDAKLDKKYQQQQDKLIAKQEQERQKLQQQQDKEHEQLEKQKPNDQSRQQLEQKHQQQTQKLVQRHAQQQQRLQEKQQPARPPEPSRPPRG
ncbi:MAG TPA: YXWGXW repeat-containing protein [Candidatus Cybelea sp.]|nr:YXWGXW repeat-containing protein [Candidatus Cybelea sp.]